MMVFPSYGRHEHAIGRVPRLRIGERPVDIQDSRRISHISGIGRISGCGQAHHRGTDHIPVSPRIRTTDGDSDTQMSAVGGQCSPQVSLSNPSTKSVGSPKQGHTANNGVGNVIAVGGAEQVLDGGRKATEVTATGIVWNLKEAKNEVNELCIKFSKLKLKYEDKEKDLDKSVKMGTDKNKLKRKSRSPEKYERLKKKIKIKPDENHEKTQKIHSIVKDPPRKIKRIDVIDLTLSDDEEQESNYIIDLTLSDDEEQGYRPSYKINRNGITIGTIKIWNISEFNVKKYELPFF
ncbi:non-muscle caldesmon-like [Aphis craccivora]|uniref:Non-muscle caldesmon-like n=1 Tax=Aphis craccivora TaxID=307492 RepID=A0A6G0VYY4_APHCR|nr:non-muscle caldesmon-like [Aphis craccivora]